MNSVFKTVGIITCLPILLPFYAFWGWQLAGYWEHKKWIKRANTATVLWLVSIVLTFVSLVVGTSFLRDTYVTLDNVDTIKYVTTWKEVENEEVQNYLQAIMEDNKLTHAELGRMNKLVDDTVYEIELKKLMVD